MFILTVVETPAINWNTFRRFYFTGFSHLYKAASLIQASAVMINSVYTTTFTCQLCLSVGMKKNGCQKKRKTFTLTCIKNCGSIPLNLAPLTLLTQAPYKQKLTPVTLPRTQARSSGFESDWDFNFALGIIPSVLCVHAKHCAIFFDGSRVFLH